MEKIDKGLTEAQVLNELRKHGASWADGWLIIESGSLGLHLLGYVDFLTNHCEKNKYKVRFKHDTRA